MSKRSLHSRLENLTFSRVPRLRYGGKCARADEYIFKLFLSTFPVLRAAEVGLQFPLLLEGHISMALISVTDLPEETLLLNGHIHFAAASTFVALSLEKGHTYYQTIE
jgi:hypothetical protein